MDDRSVIDDMAFKEAPGRERQGELNLKLMKAAEDGDIRGAAEAIKLGADVNCEYKGMTDWPDWSPLLFAVKTGNRKLAELLLDSGARIDHESDSGDAGLILASMDRDEGMCILLLKRGSRLHESTRIRYPTDVSGYFKKAYGLFAEGKDQEAYGTWKQAFRVRLGDIEQAIREDADTTLYMNVTVTKDPRWVPWKRERAGMFLYMDRRDCYAYLGMADEARSSFNNAQEVNLKAAVEDNRGTDFAESAKGLLDDIQRSGNG